MRGRDFIDRDPVHPMRFPLFSLEVVGVDERIVGDVDDAATGVPEYLAKRAKLLHRAWVVVPKQVAEHFLRREQEFLIGLEVAAWEKQRTFEWGTGASCQQDFQIHAVKTKDHEARGKRHTEVGFFLWKLKHFSHEAKVVGRFEVGNAECHRSVKNRGENM